MNPLEKYNNRKTNTYLIVGPFLRPCTSGSYVHRAAFYCLFELRLTIHLIQKF
jgi:hypothetical protein